MRHDSLRHDPVKLLRYRQDRWTVGYTLMVAAVQLALYFLVERLWLTALLVAIFLPVQAVSIACNHYQHHKSVFLARPLNRIYELLLFFQTGTPPFLITLHHNLGHHLHYLEPERDTLRWRRRDGSAMRLAEVLWRNAFGHVTWTMAIGKRFPKVYRRFETMAAISAALLIALLVYDPAKALIVFVVPMLLMVANVARLGFDQHAGCDLDDHLTASRNIESAWYNLVTFNSGYHTAHHMEPAVHWSKLPELHRRIRDRIPPELIAGAGRDDPRAPAES